MQIVRVVSSDKGEVRQAWGLTRKSRGKKNTPSFLVRHRRVAPWCHAHIRLGDFSVTSRLYGAMQIFFTFSKQLFSFSI